jgi:hypothetical protein
MLEAVFWYLLLRAFGRPGSMAVPSFAPSSAPSAAPTATPAAAATAPALAPKAAPAPLPSAAATVPPWPSTTPELPPFPGPGWEVDNPPPAEVQRKAQELLPSLWMKGAGAKHQELTGTRWMTYVAAYMGQKRGVLAYRRKGDTVTTVHGIEGWEEAVERHNARVRAEGPTAEDLDVEESQGDVAEGDVP